MKTLKKRTLLVIGLLVANLMMVQGQNFEGIAIYQSARKMNNLSFSSEGMTPDMEGKLMEQLKKQMQKEYELSFNLTESNWKEVESLDGGPATASMGGMSITIASGGSLMYKNTAENKYLEERESLGKPFLITDKLQNREWELTDESKTIGNYQAYKAIYTDTRERKMLSMSNMDGDEDGNVETKTDTIRVEAWFTPEIPVSQGPDDYWGLPGLILEVTDGTTSYSCTKVILNPEEGVKIRVPNKGKKISREEFAAEMEAKAQEMMKKFSNGRGGSQVIKIGGGE